MYRNQYQKQRFAKEEVYNNGNYLDENTLPTKHSPGANRDSSEQVSQEHLEDFKNTLQLTAEGEKELTDVEFIKRPKESEKSSEFGIDGDKEKYSVSDSDLSVCLEEELCIKRGDSNSTESGERKAKISLDPPETSTWKASTESFGVEDFSHDNNGNVRSSIRRSSSLSSFPYFYPDPYSIVVSRYFEDLGSISPSHSSATGSEATEYLPLSEYAASANSSSHRTFSDEEESEHPSTSFSSAHTLSIYHKMNFDSALSTSEEYQSFRSSVPLRKICVEADGSKEWKVYDAGPRSVRTPLLCLGPACATADVFYRQILSLTAKGMRVISVESPVYWSVEDWCKGLKKLLDCLNLDKVHIFGASLGGFLAQKFAEYTYHYSRVASLILCNTFLDTTIFDYHDSAMIFWMLPSAILKKLIIENITSARIMDLDIAHAIEFMIERLNNLSQQELACRLTLNCVNNHVDTFKLKQIKITIMDVFDESALSNQAREDLYRNYTDAKLAHLKSGGNFPYLSRSDDVNMHLMVHLRTFNGTKFAAQLEECVNSSNVSSARPISNSTNTGSSKAEDVLGSTEPQTLPVSSLVDENKAFKEEAANALGLPTR